VHLSCGSKEAIQVDANKGDGKTAQKQVLGKKGQGLGKKAWAKEGSRGGRGTEGLPAS